MPVDSSTNGSQSDGLLEEVSDQKISLKRRSEGRWPEVTHLKYNDEGKVNLNSQQSHIQTILRTAIAEMHKYLAFENAYPNLLEKQRVSSDILLAAAKGLGHKKCQDVCERLQEDSKYVRALAAVVRSITTSHSR